MRRFVLVTAVTAEPSGDVTASGIRKLKRGVTLLGFMHKYLETVKNDDAPSTLYYDREGTIVATRHGSKKVSTWNFTEYPETEIISAVSHLTREELLRDLKELLPLKELVR
jgi:hypothetical protein